MLKGLRKIINDSVTGKDNTTHDVFRWLTLFSIVVALGLTIYVVVYKEQLFDIQQFGIGLGSVFVAVGAALKLKETTEPDTVSNENNTTDAQNESK